ncbi:MAG: UbiA family prenyltransferase [Chitinophagales bacterium]|nr:UbiA family prenyltransferase [Chitinophagales bacterium]MCZ2393343.1 UbiA family prenyltransferase [Chitinophagales bacterium]
MNSDFLHTSKLLNFIIQKFENIAQWVIFSDIYITLGAVAFALSNTYFLGIDWRDIAPIYFLIGSATMFIYQFSRWTFFKNVQKELSKDKLYYWMEEHQYVVVFCLLLSVVVGGVSLFWVNIKEVIILFFLGIISFLYNINIPIGNKVLTLRRIPFAKIFLIATVWSSMAVILPWVEQNGWDFNVKVILLFLIQFLFIFIITLPFDINDIEVDKEVGVNTIPILIGVKRSKWLLSLLSFVYLFVFFLWIDIYFFKILIFQIGIFILILALLYKTLLRSKRAEKWEIMLWYDGSLIWYYLICLLSVWI